MSCSLLTCAAPYPLRRVRRFKDPTEDKLKDRAKRFNLVSGVGAARGVLCAAPLGSWGHRGCAGTESGCLYCGPDVKRVRYKLNCAGANAHSYPAW